MNVPPYGTQNPPPALFPAYPQSQGFLYNAEAPVLNQLSQQLHIPPAQSNAQKGIRISGKFNKAPGTFTFIVMESDQDVLGASSYSAVPVGSSITAANLGSDGVSFVVDLIPFAGQFVALDPTALPSNSAVTVTAVVTRS